MNQLKQLVIDFLQNLPSDVYIQYNEALSFYMKHEDKGYSEQRTYNSGYSEINLKHLLYDLQKVYQITDLELLEYNSNKEESYDMNLIDELNSEADILIESQKQHFDTKDSIIEFCSCIKVQIDKFKFKLDTLSSDISEEYIDKIEKLKIKLEMIEETNNSDSYVLDEKKFIPSLDSDQRLKIRNEFPFLAEESCPDELKILITDKINAYNKYVNAHNTLVKVANGEIQMSSQEQDLLTKEAIENHELNRLIYDELNYYKEKGKILGKHPLFRSLIIKREVESMSMDQLLSLSLIHI
jgi:hypothetical protein